MEAAGPSPLRRSPIMLAWLLPLLAKPFAHAALAEASPGEAGLAARLAAAEEVVAQQRVRLSELQAKLTTVQSVSACGMRLAAAEELLERQRADLAELSELRGEVRVLRAALQEATDSLGAAARPPTAFAMASAVLRDLADESSSNETMPTTSVEAPTPAPMLAPTPAPTPGPTPAPIPTPTPAPQVPTPGPTPEPMPTPEVSGTNMTAQDTTTTTEMAPVPMPTPNPTPTPGDNSNSAPTPALSPMPTPGPNVMPSPAPTPIPTSDSENLNVQMTVMGVDFNMLKANATALEAFKKAAIGGLALALGVDEEDILELLLSAGSVALDAIVRPPEGVTASSLQAKVRDDPTSLSTAVAAKITAVQDELEAAGVIDGPIEVSAPIANVVTPAPPHGGNETGSGNETDSGTDRGDGGDGDGDDGDGDSSDGAGNGGDGFGDGEGDDKGAVGKAPPGAAVTALGAFAALAVAARAA